MPINVKESLYKMFDAKAIAAPNTLLKKYPFEKVSPQITSLAI